MNISWTCNDLYSIYSGLVSLSVSKILLAKTLFKLNDRFFASELSDYNEYQNVLQRRRRGVIYWGGVWIPNSFHCLCQFLTISNLNLRRPSFWSNRTYIQWLIWYFERFPIIYLWYINRQVALGFKWLDGSEVMLNIRRWSLEPCACIQIRLESFTMDTILIDCISGQGCGREFSHI